MYKRRNGFSALKLCAYALWVLLTGCALSTPYIPKTQPLDSARLPAPDVSVEIANLSNCTDSPDKTLQIDSRSPITVLVHGCKGSAGRFRSLAQLYAFHGQQAVCYSYDDRKSLVDGANKLAFAVNELASATQQQSISIVGHSMGGLVARKAVEAGSESSDLLGDKNLDLVTISAPLSGIAAANHCGIAPLHWLSVGVVPGVCWLITGDNWNEIPSSSEFIRYPEALLPSVKSYLKVVTNEKGTCRREDEEGRCLASDFVFNLAEQYHPKIDSYPNVIGVEIEAGHVEIVGDEEVEPRKLLSVLQEHGVISSTPEKSKAALERLLADLY